MTSYWESECVCVTECVCVRAFVHVCVRTCVHACVCVHVCVYMHIGTFVSANVRGMNLISYCWSNIRFGGKSLWYGNLHGNTVQCNEELTEAELLYFNHNVNNLVVNSFSLQTTYYLSTKTVSSRQYHFWDIGTVWNYTRIPLFPAEQYFPCSQIILAIRQQNVTNFKVLNTYIFLMRPQTYNLADWFTVYWKLDWFEGFMHCLLFC